MWAEVNGERKKVACGPCIRGHRSSKCDHRDRVLVEVRKPGRPLSSCPHPSGSCSCERIVINYTIPKSSECACPSERAQTVATVAGNSRIQKNRRKSTLVNPSTLEKAIRAGQDTETDASSYTRASTERSGSDEASPPSSASSTPRIPPRRSETTSSCCQPKSLPQPVQQGGGGCCSGKAKQEPEVVQVKSCCSGKSSANSAPTPQSHTAQHQGQQIQFQLQPQNHTPQFSQISQQASSFPFGLGAPIYNHAAAAYQQSPVVPMSPAMHGSMASHVVGSQVVQHAPEHNCHCGDSCSCFGCAAHPNNATMMEYVRLMAQFQYTGGFGAMSPPLYDMPTYPHHPGYGAEAHQTMALNSMAQPQYGTPMSTPSQRSMPPPPSLDMSSLMQSSLAVSTSWRHPSQHAISMPEPQFYEPNNYITSTPISEVPPALKMEEQVKTPTADTPSDGKDEETPTLSPSSYFWNEMELPGCSDASGTCQCGDGCECVGCLTHGGHNGVQLEAPSLDHQTAFPSFTNDSELRMEHTADFLFNSTHT